MAYVKTNQSMLGKQVVLTEKKSSLAGYFEIGSYVTIVEVTPMRGYTFADEYGNYVAEAGWSGFKEIEND